MLEPRPPTEAELPQLLDFLNHQLRPSVQWSLAQEYPQVFSQTNLNNIRIIRDQDTILSHAVVKVLLTKTPLGLFKVAAIGSVVTHPEHRQMGLSKKTVEACVTSARQQGCDFALLWTDLFDLYRKMGFELAGSEVSVVLESEIAVAANGLRFVEGNNVSPEALLRIFAQHTVGSMRSLEDVRQFLKIPNSRLYTAWDENNILQAFAVEGRGADLTGYVHEWGGGVSKLIPLLAHIRKTQGRPITVILPIHAQNLLSRLKAFPVTVNHGFLGMVKILDATSLFFKLNRYARSMGVADVRFDYENGEYRIHAHNEVFRTQNECDIAQLIFGPGRASEMIVKSPKAAEALEQILPIPMWVWGWDSV